MSSNAVAVLTGWQSPGSPLITLRLTSQVKAPAGWGLAVIVPCQLSEQCAYSSLIMHTRFATAYQGMAAWKTFMSATGDEWQARLLMAALQVPHAQQLSLLAFASQQV